MNYKFIAYIAGTSGLKGDLKLKNFPIYLEELLKQKVNLYLGDIKINRKYSKYIINKNNAIIHFDDFDHIDDAKILIGMNIYINEDDLKLIDLIKRPEGLTVIIKEKVFGKIVKFYESGPNNFIITTNQNYHFPYHKDLIKMIKDDKIYLDEVLYED